MDACDLPTDLSFNAALDDYPLPDSNGGYDSDSSYHTAPESLHERESTVAECSFTREDTAGASFSNREEIQAELDALLRLEQLSQQARQGLEREIELRKCQEIKLRSRMKVLQGRISKNSSARISLVSVTDYVPSKSERPPSLTHETLWRLKKVKKNIALSKQEKKVAKQQKVQKVKKVKELLPIPVNATTRRMKEIFNKYGKVLNSVTENARQLPTPKHDFTINKRRSKRYFTYDKQSDSFVKPSIDIAKIVDRPSMNTRSQQFSFQCEINEDGADIACPNESNGGMCVDSSCTFSHGDVPVMRKQDYEHMSQEMKRVVNECSGRLNCNCFLHQTQPHDTPQSQQKINSLCDCDCIGEVCRDQNCRYRHFEEIYKVFGYA